MHNRDVHPHKHPALYAGIYKEYTRCLQLLERDVRVETEIKKWGNSLALRVSGVMAELPRFEPGTRVTVDIDSEGFVVRRTAGSLKSFRFPESEDALLAGMTAETAHADLLADPRGRELGL